MIERTAMLAIPPIAVATAALVLLGPGAARPAPFARAYGAAFAPRVALRLVTGNTAFAVEEASGMNDLVVVERRPSGDLVRWRGASGSDGIAEPWFDTDATDRIELVVLGSGKVLARGSVDLKTSHPIDLRDPAWITGPGRGDLHVRAAAVEGVYAVPFAGSMRVEVKDETGVPVEGAPLKIDAPGADLAPADPKTDRTGNAVVRVTPHAHVVDVGIDAEAGGKSGHWEGHLPVVPGAMVLDRPGLPANLVAPAPRERAYVSFWGPNGRLGGQVVKVASRADGFYAGAVEPLPPGSAAPIGFTLAGDPFELGAGTVSWSTKPGFAIPPKLELVFDGAADALAAEQARAWKARRLGIAVIFAAGIAEILLLIANGRRAQAGLEKHFAQASDDPNALRPSRSGTAWALAAAVIIALSFGLVAALAAFR